MKILRSAVPLFVAATAFGQGIERMNPDGLTKPTAYHHVIKIGNLLFIAGQVSLDAQGNLVGENDMKAQVRQVMENLKTALASQKADFSNVVKVNIFTTSIDQFREAADVREAYFRGHPPASTLVQIQRLARTEFLVEIEAIAARKA
jgi:reactive intermediate/imine deaminase